MEVRPGYKQTEVGVIPEDWEVKTFAQLFAFRNGVNADKQSYGQGIRFVNVLEPITYSHLYGPEIPGRVTLPEPVAASFAVRRGDVLFNRTSETQDEVGLAATFLGADPVVFGGFVIRGRPTDQSLDPIFSGYALRAPSIRLQIVPMGQGAIRANVGQQNLSIVVAPVPPLVEQCSIAEALSDADALIESLERLIAKKRQLKQGAMQELITGKKRLPGFERKSGYKQTEVGVIPEDWGLEVIENIACITTGRRNTQDRVDDGRYPFFVRSQILERINSYSFDGEAVLAAGDGVGTGKVVHYIEGKFDAHQRVYCISDFSERISGYFFYLYFGSHFYARIMRMTAKSSVDSVRREMIARMLIPLPPTKAEQIAIGTSLSDMDAEIAVIEAKLAKARCIKQGMMQELLTGRIRLV